MASTPPHIPDMGAAIAAGVVPGRFSADRTVFAFPTLEYASASAGGAVHLWTIRVRLLCDDDYVPFDAAFLSPPAPPLPGCTAEISVETSQKEGKVRDTVPTYVSAGKNLGKKNATNAAWQAIRDALGLYNKQLKKAHLVAPVAPAVPAAGQNPTLSPPAPSGGPPASKPAPPASPAPVAPAQKPPSAHPASAVGPRGFDPMPPPMLVKQLGATRDAVLGPADFKDGVTVQRKFNGVRLVAFAREGALVQYSRAGTEYPGQRQIVAELLPMLLAAPHVAPGQYGLPAEAKGPGGASERDRLILRAYGVAPEGDPARGDPLPYIDGELYVHGKSLNWISGQARRGDDEGLLVFHVFDVFFPRAKQAGHDMPSRHRQEYLDAFFAAASAAESSAGFARAAAHLVQHPHVIRVENYPAGSMEQVERLAKGFLAEGFEGAIARKDGAGYVYGYSSYHSSNLVKIKPKRDAEFPVVGFAQGRRGKDVGALLWVCEVPDAPDPKDCQFTVAPKSLSYRARYALFACLSRLVDDPKGGPDSPKITLFDRDLRGLPLTVQFDELSPKTGKPLRAKALTFRTYEGGPARDPVRRLFEECGVLAELEAEGA